MDTSPYRVLREAATSKDGTKVPVNVIQRKTAADDGSQACIVTGYGGFGISRSPYFSLSRAVLLEQGIAFIETNLRGGSEFGEEWHLQGNLTHKQNVFDDFTAAVDYVVQRGYCARDRLAIMGGSNGGLLVGAVMVQHPEKMKAVVGLVGYYDMLRYAESPNGQFNIPEYGSVKDPEQFRALYAYSPYHHVSEGTKYPAALFLTGANDPRVAPWHSRKMVARLQAANAADTQILLRTSATSGHGGHGKSLSETIDELTDVDAFLFAQLGVTYGSASAKP